MDHFALHKLLSVDLIVQQFWVHGWTWVGFRDAFAQLLFRLD
jgi:hypothetical protein